MKIKSIVPNRAELRKYLEDILQSDFGFSEEIKVYVLRNYFPTCDKLSEINISTLSDHFILTTLENFNQLPQVLYYIVDEVGNNLSYCNSLTNLEGLQYDIENGGIAVFEAFRSQIKYLINEKGEIILGPCHDLSLGLNFTIESRSPENPASWEYFIYKNNKLIHVISGYFDSLDFFPYSYERDQFLKNATENQWDNEDYVTQSIIETPISILFASERLRNDRVFIKSALSKSEMYFSNIFPYLPIEFREDPEIYSLVGISDHNFEKTVFNPDDYSKMKNEKLLLKILENNYSLLQYFTEKFRSRKDIILTAVKKYGSLLKFASDELKEDNEVVITAITNNGNALQFASDELKSEREIAITAVNENGEALEFVSDSLKADKEIVLIAVNKYGRALQFASNEMKSDKEVALAAVKKNGYALQFVSDVLKDDKEVINAAIKYDGLVLQFASKNLRNDREMFELALSNRSIRFNYKTIAGDLIIQDKVYI